MKYKLKNPVHGSMGTEKYQCRIEWRNGQFIADEPESAGGKDTGPDPFTLLLSSLASCTLVTLRMYIDRKGWDIQDIAVNANLFQVVKDGKTVSYIDRDISFPGTVDEEYKAKLLDIAKACPISKILENEVVVRSFMYHETNVEKKINYTNGEVTIVWKPEFCAHSGRCVTQLPQVFNLKEHPWINAKGADTEAIIEQVKKCPTGALSYFYNNKKDS